MKSPEIIFPRKLHQGDRVAIVAPSESMECIASTNREIAIANLRGIGLEPVFAPNVDESDFLDSASVERRVADLHWAFGDPSIGGILSGIGGYNTNTVLDHLDWDLVKENPKVLCGYSDITALQHALLAKAGLVSYHGPHFSTFGQRYGLEYTAEYFRKCLFDEKGYDVEPSPIYSDDLWYEDQEGRLFLENPPVKILNPGRARGTIIGGNLNTLNLLTGSEYMPRVERAIMFIEDTQDSTPHIFERDLQALMHWSGFEAVVGMVIGRFQKLSEMNSGMLSKIINLRLNRDIPVLCGLDFGHTDPKFTFPIGGEAEVSALEGDTRLRIIKH